MPERIYWTHETLTEVEVHPSGAFGIVRVTVEVPHDHDTGERLPWRGRRYFPAFVDVESSAPTHLLPGLVDAIEMARAAADAFDALDSNPDGSWWFPGEPTPVDEEIPF